MDTLKIIEVTATVSPEEIADLFCSMDCKEMATFFNSIATIAKTWENDFGFQMQSVTDNPMLLPSGREIMKVIGNYSQPLQLAPAISFDQAIDEVSDLYESTKEHLNNSYYMTKNMEIRVHLDKVLANNVKMRDYACVALQRAYGINVGSQIAE